MDGIISLPICSAGFFLYPDFPQDTRAFYLNEEDKKLAVSRMERIGRKERTKLGWDVVKRVFGRWHVYALTVLYIIFINTGPSSSINPMSLWLKASGFSVTLTVSKVRPKFFDDRLTPSVEHYPDRTVGSSVGDDCAAVHIKRLSPEESVCHVDIHGE